ncbi:uncharacterized protein LOC143911674 [Arctopsyche grandis]|uniref:uncharacterized protein LOC143911674 n=1 Tax=Arctopsyche grandis TaxID=121162 RepID=UPI00406D80E6
MCEEFSPPLHSRRRRSSLFCRRDSFVPDRSGNEDKNSIEDDHKRYLEKLKNESDAWKQLYKYRKSKIQDVERKFKESEKLQILDDNTLNSILSNDIKEFLRNKPEVDEIVRESIELCEEFEITKELYNNLLRSNERITEYVRKGTDCIIESICNDSLSTNI